MLLHYPDGATPWSGAISGFCVSEFPVQGAGCFRDASINEKEAWKGQSLSGNKSGCLPGAHNSAGLEAAHAAEVQVTEMCRLVPNKLAARNGGADRAIRKLARPTPRCRQDRP